MSVPKLNAMLFCVKAVRTEPWWNLIGVFDQCLADSDGSAQFDLFLKLGDVRSDHDSTVSVHFIDPSRLQLVESFDGIVRGGLDGVVERPLAIDIDFPRDGDYHVEVFVDDDLIDAQLLRVYLAG
jgi:hypothetical protein